MIRVLFLILLALALGASGAYYIRGDAGYVLLAYQHWSLETTLLGFIVAAAVIFLVLRYGLRVVFAGLRLPSTLKQSVNARRERRARESFETGLSYWLDGRWQKAEVELVRRAADHPANGLNYLLAARAAEQLGAAQRSAHYLQQATEIHSGGALLLRANQAIAQKEWLKARELLAQLRAQDPNHESMIERLAEVLVMQQDWDALRELLTASATQQALSEDRQFHWQLRLANGLLQAALDAARLDQFKAVWEQMAAKLRADRVLRNFYIRGLLRLNAEADAAAAITSELRTHFDAELVTIYSDAQGLDAITQLASAEDWLNRYGEKPEVLLLAARAALRAKLWGKARGYLDALVRVAPSANAYLELAHLCEQTQSIDEANQFYRKGLEAATR